MPNQIRWLINSLSRQLISIYLLQYGQQSPPSTTLVVAGPPDGLRLASPGFSSSGSHVLNQEILPTSSQTIATLSSESIIEAPPRTVVRHACVLFQGQARGYGRTTHFLPLTLAGIFFFKEPTMDGQISNHYKPN